MGVSIAASRATSANPNIIAAIVTVTSSSALTDPSSALFANITAVRQQVGAPATWIISNMSFVQVTQPSGMTYVYTFNITMSAPGSSAVPLFGPRGPVGSQGPQGPVGPTGPQGRTGAVGPQGQIGPPGQTGPVGPVGPQGR